MAGGVDRGIVLGDDLAIFLKPYIRSAIGTSNGLGMETAVKRVLVFKCAGIAKWKDPHRRGGTVIRDVFNDCETRPAIGAIDEGIVVTAVGRIEHFMQAVIADAHVR